MKSGLRALLVGGLLGAPLVLQIAPVMTAQAQGAFTSAVSLYNQQKYEQSLPAFEALAAAGNSQAMWYVALHHEMGLGTPASNPTAYEWFRKSADAGNADGQYGVALMNARGQGIPQNTEQALYWYTQAARSGSAKAQYELGRRYYYADGVKSDFVKAAEYWKAAAEQGHDYAMAQYGYLLQYGQGVKVSMPDAIGWYEKAAALNNPYALQYLGYNTMWGVGVPYDVSRARDLLKRALDLGQTYAGVLLQEIENGTLANGEFGPGQLDLAINLYYAGKYSEALPIFRELADLKTARAMTYLGEAYEKGYGVSQSDTEAFKWYLAAAERDERFGANAVGYFYEFGVAVPADPAKAMEWYKRAAELGNPEGAYNVSQLYYEGVGVPVDFTQSAVWAEKAASAGYAQAQANLGYAHEMGEGVKQDFCASVKWYELAANQGDAYGELGVANAYFNGDCRPRNMFKARMYYQRAAAQGQEDAKAYLIEFAEELKTGRAAGTRFGPTLSFEDGLSEEEKILMLGDRKACYSGVHAKAKASGWQSLPRELIEWAVAQDAISAYPLRSPSPPPSCKAHRGSGDFSDGSMMDLVPADEAITMLNAQDIEISLAGWKHFADQKNNLSATLNLARYRLSQSSTSGEAFNYFSKAANLGSGEGYWGVGLIQFRKADLSWGNEQEVYRVVETLSRILPLFQVASDLGFKRADANISEIYEIMGRADNFVDQAKLNAYYQQRAEDWRNCNVLGPIGKPDGYTFTCPKDMVPKYGVRRDIWGN